MKASVCQDLLITLSVLLCIVCYSVGSDEGCNGDICGSVVTKCLLTQRCQCKVDDGLCYKDCLNCMGDLYMECCSCLEMCPNSNNHADLSELLLRSETGDIVGGGVPELFELLTAEDDDESWTTIRFPMRVRGSEANERLSVAAQKAATTVVNCTVIYLNPCIPSSKCQEQCESMGAHSYRWFHDGCCQCVGEHCPKYGINESRCSMCLEEDLDEELDEEDEENWYFGEDENFYD